MKDEEITLNIPVYEILLVIGIIITIIGILAPFQLIEIFDFELWLDPRLSMICLPVGIGLICGYINQKIMPEMKKSTAILIGLVLGIIGLIIVICMKFAKKENKKIYNNSFNKYEELEKLAKLKQSGVLTEEEFEIEKSKILKVE